jgi:hypothetical protein
MPSFDITRSLRALKFENLSKNELKSAKKLLKNKYENQNYSIQSSDCAFGPIINLKPIVDEDWNFYLKLIEDVLVFYRLYARSRNIQDIGIACLAFAKLRTQDSLLVSVFRDKLYSYVVQLFSMRTGLELQSFDEYLTSARDGLNKYDELTSSKLYKKLYKACMYGLSLSLFSKFGITLDSLGYKRMEKEAIRQKYHKKHDFVHCMLDTLLFLLERGHQCMKQNSFEPLFHSGNEYVKLYEMASELKKQSLLLSDPELYGFTESQFLADLDETIERSKAIYRHASITDSTERKMIRKTLDDLEMIRCEQMLLKNARSPRKAPFSILLYGDSGIGKSTLISLLFTHYGKKRKLNTDPTFMYTKNPVAKYWDGFKTSQWAVCFDDIAFMNPTIASAGGDPTCMEVIQVINAVPFTPDQASIELKGKNPLRSEFVIGTTNTSHMNAFFYFSCPSAMQRRFPYVITVAVKPEFKNANGMLDSAKVKNFDLDNYPDMWTFKVAQIIPQSVHEVQRSVAQETVLLSNVGMSEFLDWYNVAIDEHHENQNKMLINNKHLNDIKLSTCCYKPVNMCSCKFDVQSYDILYQCFGLLILFEIWRKCRDHIFMFYRTVVLCFRIYYVIYFLKNKFYKVRNICESVLDNYGYRNNVICNTVFGNYGVSDRIKFFRLGEKVRLFYYNDIRTFEFFKHALVFLTAALVTYKATRMLFGKKFEGELNSQDEDSYDNFDIQIKPGITRCVYREEGVRPKPQAEYKGENVWYNTQPTLSSFDVGAQSCGYNSLNEGDFQKILLKNCIFLRLHSNRGVFRDNKAICVYNQTYLLNYHFIKGEDGLIDFEIFQSPIKPGVNDNFVCRLHISEFKRISNTDLCFIKIKDIPPRKDISGLFMKRGFTHRLNGFYVSRDKQGLFDVKKLNHIVDLGMYDVPGISNPVPCWGSKCSVPTVNGDCGGVAYVRTSYGPVIIGIHMAGYESNAITHKVFFEDLPTSDKVIKPSDPKLSAIGYEHSLIELHSKANIRYIPEGVARIYGSLAGSNASYKSNVEPSIMSHFLTNHDFKIKYGKPVMSGWEVWNKALTSSVDVKFLFDGKILDTVVEDMFKYVFPKIPKKQLDEVKVYDIYTSINGAPGVKYVDSINKSTSMGHPWRKSKKFFLHEQPEDSVPDGVMFNDSVLERINLILERYSTGELYHPIFTAQLKDEPRSFNKIRDKKTRVFTSAPADWSIVVRKLYLPLVKLIQDNKLLFSSAPGAAAQSYEWHDFHEYLTHFGEDKMIAGDYANFDKTMSSRIILASFDFLIRIAESCGYSDQAITQMMCVAYDTAFPTINYNGDIIQFMCGMPSGHPLTVIINCIANNLYMRYCYKILCPYDFTKDFSEVVHLLTYGDDNIMGVSNEVPWFNHTSIRDTLIKYGIDYTMADKEAPSVPYISIYNCTFLKRSWKWNNVLEAYVAPLDEDSIEKMLMVWIRSKSVSQEEQCVSIISSAVSESFFHGQEYFNTLSNLMWEMIKKLNIEEWTDSQTIPTYSQLCQRYHICSLQNSDNYKNKYEVTRDFMVKTTPTTE